MLSKNIHYLCEDGAEKLFLAIRFHPHIYGRFVYFVHAQLSFSFQICMFSLFETTNCPSTNIDGMMAFMVKGNVHFVTRMI